VHPSPEELIRTTLEGGREAAARIHAGAQADAAMIAARAAESDRRYAAERIVALGDLRAELAASRHRIDAASLAIVEAMAAAARRLALAARHSDFEPPRWPTRPPTTMEIKLSQTRELTISFDRRGER
jgi:hypothetical protein